MARSDSVPTHRNGRMKFDYLRIPRGFIEPSPEFIPTERFTMHKPTKTSMITDCANRGLTKRQAERELRPLVETQTPPMVFTFNPGGGAGAESKADVGAIHRIAVFHRSDLQIARPLVKPPISNRRISAQVTKSK